MLFSTICDDESINLKKLHRKTLLFSEPPFGEIWCFWCYGG